MTGRPTFTHNELDAFRGVHLMVLPIVYNDELADVREATTSYGTEARRHAGTAARRRQGGTTPLPGQGEATPGDSADLSPA